MHKYALIVLLLAFADLAHCDGLEFDGDRYSGAKTILQLSSDQIGKEKIILSHDQTMIIMAATGKRINKLWIWKISDAQNTCTCELSNIGIRYNNYVVVPLWLVSEKEDGGDREYKEFDKKYYDFDYRVDGLCVYRMQAYIISVIFGVIAIFAMVYIIMRLRQKEKCS